MKNHVRLAALCLVAALFLGLGMAAKAEEQPFIAENLEISTYRGVAVGGRFTLEDYGSEVIGFEVTTPPTKGSVEIGEDGCFVYTPDEGKKGKDYFGYKAIDAEGRYSQEATVIISIKKQKNNISYTDMREHPSAWAAISLAEEGIFVGEKIGSKYVFRPDENVSRGEFLVMCMLAAETDLMRDVKSTGFADDEQMLPWTKPYVATALSRGYINGYESEDGIVFSPDETVSAREAAVIMDNVMDFTDAIAVWYSYDELLPDWAVQAAANLSACEIIPESVSLLDDTLTRAEAAEMICNAMETMEARG